MHVNLLRILPALLIAALLAGCKADKAPAPAPAPDADSIATAQAEFYFTGMHRGKAAVFHYTVADSSQSIVWSSATETVSALLPNPERTAYYLVTTTGSGKNGIFSYINGVKVYYLSPEGGKFKLVKAMGDGIQAYPVWDNTGVFKVSLNAFVKGSDTTVAQVTGTFDAAGTVISTDTATYQVLSQGWPLPPRIPVYLQAPSGAYSLSQAESGEIFLKNEQTRTTTGVVTTTEKLKKALYPAMEHFVAFATVDVSEANETLYSEAPQTSTLILYNIKESTIEAKWEGGGYKHFYTIGYLLVFETGFGDRSEIVIYNIKTATEVRRIKLPGGCGLQGIPAIPDYSA